MKIKTTITLVFITSLMIASISGLYLFYLNAEAVLEERTYKHLESVTESRAHHIETFLDDRQMKVDLMATSLVYRDLLNASRKDADYAVKYETANKRLQIMVDADSEIFKSCILDKNGIVVASTDEESVGANKSTSDIFLKGREKTYINEISKCTLTDKPDICISAPIKENNELLGVVVICSSIDKLNEITAEKSGLGLRGETYLVNREGYRITPSRSMNNTFMEQKVDSLNARNCRAHKHKEHVADEVTAVYRNYRGVNVLGTHAFIEEMGWCLLAEIDEADVLGAQRAHLLEVFLLSTFIIITCVIIFSFLISRLISKPIERLTETIEDISRGKLDVRVEGKERNDEIGDLARAFDRTLVSLKLAMKQTAPELRKEREELKKIIEGKTKTEDALKKAKEYSEALIQKMPSAVFTVDLEKRITSWNSRAEEITGLKEEEVLGKKCTEIWHCPSCLEKCKLYAEDVEKPIYGGECLITVKGKTFQASKNIDYLRNEKGDIIGGLEIFRDATDHEQTGERNG